MSNKGTEALKRHRERVKSGEIATKKPRNPRERFEDDPTSRAKAIHAVCWECTGFQREEIRQCPMTSCPLYNFRPYKEAADE